VYDDRPHPGGWYYWLEPGERFDLRQRGKALVNGTPGPVACPPPPRR
jgi:hypothetical protein